jgi:hypothetical protein
MKSTSPITAAAERTSRVPHHAGDSVRVDEDGHTARRAVERSLRGRAVTGYITD